MKQRFEQLSQSQGLLSIAFAQWEGKRFTREQRNPCVFPSEFVHVNVALATAARRPVLLLKERLVAERGVLRRGYVRQSIDMPKSLDIGWLDLDDFKKEFNDWAKKVKEYRDVFRAYSSNASDVADKIRELLTKKLVLVSLTGMSQGLGKRYGSLSRERCERRPESVAIC